MSTFKKFKSVLIVLFILLGFTLQAQKLSKIESKQLKKELRKMLKEPIKYKFLKDNLEVKDVIVQEQLDELKQLSRENKIVQAKLNQARDSIGFYENKVVEYNAPPEN